MITIIAISSESDMEYANKWLAHLPSFVDKLIVTTIKGGETQRISDNNGIALYNWGYDKFNFSDARNHALSLVKTDWCIMVDIDERIQLFKDDVDLILSYPDDVYGADVRLNCFTNQGDCGGSYDVTRIIRKQVRYEYYCHETPIKWINENGFKIVATPITLRHDSYQDTEAVIHKLNRNYDLVMDNIQVSKANRRDPKLIGDLLTILKGFEQIVTNN